MENRDAESCNFRGQAFTRERQSVYTPPPHYSCIRNQPAAKHPHEAAALISQWHKVCSISRNYLMKNLIIFSALLFIAIGCSKENDQIEPDHLLIGVWKYSDSNGHDNIYIRSNEFIENHCYKFNSDGTMTERQNSGWCGTPPITYADYPGTWNMINDTLIQINVGYWGGTFNYKLDIQSVDSDVLQVSFVPADK